MFFEKHMTAATNETVFSGEACPTPLPTLEQDVAQVVGACMLARQINSDYALGPNESAFMQHLLLNPESTKEDLLTAIKGFGSATNDRAVEGTAATLRPAGLIETIRTWRTTQHKPVQVVIDAAQQTIAERKDGVEVVREMLRNGLGEDFHRAIDESRSMGAQNHLHHYALDRLFENLGWPIPSSVLTRPGDKANNIQRILKEIERGIPEGILRRIGEKNKTKYMLDLQKLAGLKLEQNPIPEVVSIDTERFTALKLALYIRSDRAIILLDLLEQQGGTLSRKRINELFSLANKAVTKNKMYIAIKELRKHGLVLTHEDDAQIPEHTIKLRPDFNLEDYGEDGEIRRAYRERRRALRKGISDEARATMKRRQQETRIRNLQNNPEWVKKKALEVEQKEKRRKEIEDLAIARAAERQRISEERERREAQRRAEMAQKKAQAEALRQQKAAQKLAKIGRDARAGSSDTTGGRYPNMRRKPRAMNDELVLHVRSVNPELVEVVLAQFIADTTPLDDEILEEIALDFGLTVEDAKSTLCHSRAGADTPLFRDKDGGILPAAFAVRMNRSIKFLPQND